MTPGHSTHRPCPAGLNGDPIRMFSRVSIEPQMIPGFFSISSSGMPLLAGTIIFTQSNSRDIQQQKHGPWQSGRGGAPRTNPVRRTPQCPANRTVVLRKNPVDKHPVHRAFANRERDDKDNQTNQQDHAFSAHQLRSFGLPSLRNRDHRVGLFLGRNAARILARDSVLTGRSEALLPQHSITTQRRPFCASFESITPSLLTSTLGN